MYDIKVPEDTTCKNWVRCKRPKMLVAVKRFCTERRDHTGYHHTVLPDGTRVEWNQ